MTLSDTGFFPVVNTVDGIVSLVITLKAVDIKKFNWQSTTHCTAAVRKESARAMDKRQGEDNKRMEISISGGLR